MASIEEETQKRYKLMKQLNPWGAIDYLEDQLAERDQRIAELERKLELCAEKLLSQPV